MCHRGCVNERCYCVIWSRGSLGRRLSEIADGGPERNVNHVPNASWLSLAQRADVDELLLMIGSCACRQEVHAGKKPVAL